MAESPPPAFAGCIDLASADLGGQALACSDDFFADMHHLVQRAPAQFDPQAYTDRGKLMDGWESRRKRVPGHDWCILRLGVPGRIRGVDIDTAHFLGNHPPYASLEAINAPPGMDLQALRTTAVWTEIVAPMPLQRGSHNLAAVHALGRFTHVRLRIYPDGGVARLRVYGRAEPRLPTGRVIDLAAAMHGGRALACSDMFFSPMQNLLLPQPAAHMGQGWETRRSRPPGEDWVIVALGSPGLLAHALVDTAHFKGNFPHAVGLEGVYWPDAPLPALVGCSDWTPIVPPRPCAADKEHTWAIDAPGPWTHVRMRVIPDGGVSRLRVLGTPTQQPPADPALAALNAMSPADHNAALARCCGSRRWAQAMAAAAPFSSRTQLHGLADWHWWQLDDADWREAFTHHPRIGADPEALRARFGSTADWSEGEQAGVQGASPKLLTDLAQQNDRYFARHGYIFIVCASGLGAQEMLDRLLARIDNDLDNELRIAAGEQARITRLRLNKLLEGSTP